MNSSSNQNSNRWSCSLLKDGGTFLSKSPPQNADKGLAISRILSSSRDRHRKTEVIIPLGSALLPRSSELTRKLRAGRTQTLSYLFLLRTEFGCFHSGGCRSPSLRRSNDTLDLPFPIKSPRTFSLFHCSSACAGGSLTPVLPYGVRTFLTGSLLKNNFRPRAKIICSSLRHCDRLQDRVQCTTVSL